MRRGLPLLLALAVVAAACSTSEPSASLDPSSPDPSTAQSTSTTEPSTTQPEPESGTEPVLVTVPQIEGDDTIVRNSAFWSMSDPDFPEPLVDLELIRSGGPPPDGIPPIDTPRFEVAETVGWIADDEPVLVLDIGGEARAYPISILVWHEIVNDTFGEVPVTVAYCPLCNSALAYDRRVRTADGVDRVLDFGTSGLLLHSSLVMYDRQTESLWSHFTAQAVVGELTGTELATFPVRLEPFENFASAHPDGLVLSRQTGYHRDYGETPYPNYDQPDTRPFLLGGDPDPRLPAKTRVLVVRGEAETIVATYDDLSAAGSIAFSLDGRDLVATHAAGMVSALDTELLEEGRDTGFTTVVDADGNLVEHLDTFWFAIAAFEPDVRFVAGTS